MADITPDIEKSIADACLAGFTLKQACEDRGLTVSQVWRYRQKNPVFDRDLTRAREEGAHALADEAMAIVDDPTINPHVARNRAQIRQWLAERRNRKAYGQHVDLNITERVDISGALIEARRRVSLPVRDQALIEDAQVIDSIPLIGMRSTDLESVEPAAAPTRPLVNPFD